MEDEGYTSPVEDFDVLKEKEGVGQNLSSCPKYPYYDKVVHSWDEIRIQHGCSKSLRHFLTDNNVPARLDFVTSLWRIAPDENNVGSLIHIKSLPQEPVYIPMSRFISDLFHLLQGRESFCFPIWSEVQEDGHEVFRRNPVILIKGFSPTVLDNYTKTFLECGCHFRKLSILSKKQIEKHLLAGNSCIFSTFQTALRNYLKLYRTVLMLNAGLMTTLTKFQNFIHPYHIQFQVLECIAEIALKKSPVALISELNRMIFSQETPYIQDLVRSLFILIASTYLRYISDWIFRGALTSPMDFHIKAQANSPAMDRRFWTRQFVEYEKVPLFVEDSTDLIFETGKAFNLLNLIKTLDFSKSVSSLFSYETNQMLKFVPSFDNLSPLTTEWDTKLHQFLTDNKHLTQGIKESISDVLSKSFREVPIDLSTVESVRQSYGIVATESKSQRLMKKQSAQQKFRLSLQEQVEESKLRKESEKQRELLESISNASYNTKKQQEYDNEKIKFQLKYFPETISNFTTTAENVSVVVEPEASVDLQEVSVPVEQSPEPLDNNDELAQPETVASPQDLDVVDFPKERSDVVTLKQITTRKRNFNKKVGKTIEEILAFKQEPVKEVQPGLTPIILEDGEELLDPEKFILTPSLPVRKFNPEVLWQKPKLEWKNDDKSNSSEASYLNLLFAQSIAIPLRAQHKMVNTALLYYFIKEKSLFHHLSAMNEFLLLQNGVFGHKLTELFINEIQRSPPKSLDEFRQKTESFELILNQTLSLVHLNHNVDRRLTQNLSFVVAHKEDIMMKEVQELENGKGKGHASSEYQFLNALRLTYVVEWPLNIILTEDMINHYESLFGLLMQLARSEQLLNRIFVLLKAKLFVSVLKAGAQSVQLLKLQNYRHKLLHFVRTLRVYVSMDIVHAGWVNFCSSLRMLDSLQSIYDQIVRYVRELSANCFLSFSTKGSGVLKLILRHLAIVDSFCSQLIKICGNDETFQWDNGGKISESEFTLLRRKHSAAWQFHKMLLSTLYKAAGREAYGKVESFLEFHDHNKFYEMLVTKTA